MIVFALVAAVLSPPGMIADADTRTVYSGFVGRDGWAISPDCGEWISARRKHHRGTTAVEAWVAGLISGYNLYHPADRDDALDLLGGKKLADAYAWIDQRCANSPEAALADVTLDLIGEWRKH
jgi:hypothetical protein